MVALFGCDSCFFVYPIPIIISMFPGRPVTSPGNPSGKDSQDIPKTHCRISKRESEAIF